MKIAVATFIYPEPSVRRYAMECLASLAHQTHDDFDLFVFNDGLDDVESVLSAYGPLASIIEVGGTPADIRRQAIRYLRDSGFDTIIFADIDDLFDKNRVTVAVEMIAGGVDVALNELVLFGEGVADKGGLFLGRLEEQAVVKLEDIRDGNCFGMSNTAVRVSAIPDSVFEPTNVPAFDWFFYSCVLMSGAISRFTARTATYYRQHPNNIAAICNLTDGNIIRGLGIKRRHFEVFCPSYAAELMETERLIKQNEECLATYCSAVREAMRPQPFWWESIKTYKELGL